MKHLYEPFLHPGKLFVGGHYHEPVAGAGSIAPELVPTINPATEAVICDVAMAGSADVEAAVQAAQQAFAAWRKVEAAQRGRRLWRLAELVEQHHEALALLESMDGGKPISDTRKIDLPEAIACLRYFAGYADKLGGATIPVAGAFLNYTQREPLGVCVAIVPWNFPLLMAIWKLAPALAAGNAMIIKPASPTPLSALALGDLLAQAGFPEGLVSVLPGSGAQVGRALVAHPDVAKISFTGSTTTGRAVMAAAAAGVKRVSLELGGKSPNIIFADANLGKALKGALTGIFYNMGEACTAGSRLLVESSIYERVLDLVAGQAKRLRVGDPLEEKTRLGPLVSAAQLETVMRYIEVGKGEARLVVGGGRVDRPGYFVEPTVFAEVPRHARIAQEEIFGPVLAVMKFATEEEAVEMANDSPYGLAAGVWTENLSRAHRMASALAAGTVWVNTFHSFDPGSPFGGVKQSGFGQELGRQGLAAYTQEKSIWVQLDSASS